MVERRGPTVIAALIATCVLSLASCDSSSRQDAKANSSPPTLLRTPSGLDTTSFQTEHTHMSVLPASPSDVVVQCHESMSMGEVTYKTQPADLVVGRLITVELLLRAQKSIPLAADANLKVNTAHPLVFRKAPLSISASNHRSVTITVPPGEQYLVWVPPGEWSTPNGRGVLDVARYVTHKLTIMLCGPHSQQLLLGGILSDSATRCFPLKIQIEGEPPSVHHISLIGKPCS